MKINATINGKDCVCDVYYYDVTDDYLDFELFSFDGFHLPQVEKLVTADEYRWLVREYLSIIEEMDYEARYDI